MIKKLEKHKANKWNNEDRNWQRLHCALVLHIVLKIKGKRKVQGVPQSQTAALPRHQEEKETDKSKQAQIEQTYEKH